MKKKLLTILTALTISMCSMTAYAGAIVDSTVNVYIDNKPSNIKLKNVNGFNYISVRDISEVLNYDIFWYDASKTVSVSDSAHTLAFIVGTQGYYDNGVHVSSGNTPTIIDDKVYVSFRDILSGTEVYFVYTANDNTLRITSNTYDANGKKILSSEEYADKYINNPSNAYSSQYQYKNTIPNQYYYPSYNKPDLSETIQNAEDLKNQALQNAAEAQAKVNEYQQQLAQLNEQRYAEACKQAYLDYMFALKNPHTESAEQLEQEYLNKVERLKIIYGIDD